MWMAADLRYFTQWKNCPLFAALQAVAAKTQPKQKITKNVPKSAPRVGGKRWAANQRLRLLLTDITYLRQNSSH